MVSEWIALALYVNNCMLPLGYINFWLGDYTMFTLDSG